MLKGSEMTPKDRLIEVKMSKTVLFLTETELLNLLSTKSDLWAMAIRRGKAIKRAKVAKARQIRRGQS